MRYAALMRGAWQQKVDMLVIALEAGGILVAVVAALLLWRDGPTNEELGKVARFGSYATDRGHQPTVIVRAADGRRRELKASPESLRHCRVGGTVRLIRTEHSLQVDPRGCL